MTKTVAADFSVLQAAVTQQFKRMRDYQLFRVGIPGDELWNTYLTSFPEGTNPIYKTRREYDCTCCKQFIRGVGNMVAIDGEERVISLWDIEPTGVAEFDAVTSALSHLVHSHRVCDIFLHREFAVGQHENRVLNTDGAVHTFRHFYLSLPSTAFRLNGRNEALGIARTNHEVLVRSLDEISTDALETVIDLIKQNSLYRGGDYQQAVIDFYAVKRYSERLSFEKRVLYLWKMSKGLRAPVTHIKNTSIGTLLVDLSNGTDLDAAVRSYDAKVAPVNYKRPTALVTKAMIDKAKSTLDTLGLTPALERRYATVNDITVQNLLFVDRSTKGHLKGGVLDALAPTKAVKTSAHVEEVSLEKFLRDILPVSTGLEVLVENAHTPNFMSLIAPVHADAPKLFKWDNGFSWSYTGDVTDSIKERVKNAGGNVTGDLRCSLSWSNYDDLDLHLLEPDGYEIFFMNKRIPSPSYGMLDVDMNAGSGTTRTPVENIYYAKRTTMKAGVYRLGVHQYYKRESTNVGFTVEVEFDGQIHTLVHPGAVSQNGKVEVARIHYTPERVPPQRARSASQTNGFTLTPLLPLSTASKLVWGVPTQQFRKVTMVMRSPNYWDGQAIGNQHLFFMLEGCRHEGTVRGIYNEFLRSELDPHRKVMELVGSKVRTEESDQQLSGLGFSTTQRNHLVCRVTGSFTRQVKVII